MAKQENKPEAEKPGTEVVSAEAIEAALKNELTEFNDRVGAAPSNKISLKGKVFTTPDGKSDTELSIIVLDWRHVLANYPGAYSPNNPQDPDCFAVGIHKPESGQLLPHDTIEKPWGENCRDCPKNQWKSAAQGNGKACKNQARIIAVGANPSTDSQPATLFVSPTGLKNWNAYLTELATVHGLNVLQVVTTVTFDPNETYPKLQFKMSDKHAALQTVWALKARYQEMIDRPIELRGNDGK